MKLVRVQWVDSAGMAGGPWLAADETIGIAHCESVGFLHERTKEKVVLVGTRQRKSGRVACAFAIPAGAITKIERL